MGEYGNVDRRVSAGKEVNCDRCEKLLGWALYTPDAETYCGPCMVEFRAKQGQRPEAKP